jgi:hypothetical protein
MAQCDAEHKYFGRCGLMPNHVGEHCSGVVTWTDEAAGAVKKSDDVKATQVGGSHYINDSGIQPWDIIAGWNLDYWEGNVVKYVLRYRKKNGVEDLKKARHYLDYLIQREEEYGDVGDDGRS